jgi:hypothetical protein
MGGGTDGAVASMGGGTGGAVASMGGGTDAAVASMGDGTDGAVASVPVKFKQKGKIMKYEKPSFNAFIIQVLVSRHSL